MVDHGLDHAKYFATSGLMPCSFHPKDLWSLPSLLWTPLVMFRHPRAPERLSLHWKEWMLGPLWPYFEYSMWKCLWFHLFREISNLYFLTYQSFPPSLVSSKMICFDYYSAIKGKTLSIHVIGINHHAKKEQVHIRKYVLYDSVNRVFPEKANPQRQEAPQWSLGLGVKALTKWVWERGSKSGSRWQLHKSTN